MDTYTVQVDVSTHDALKAGVLVTATATVVVLADGDTQAKLFASQVAARNDIPTDARIVGLVC